MKSPQELAAGMFKAGYRYRLTFGGTNAPPMLFIKSSADAGPLLRTMYPNNTIEKVERIEESGLSEVVDPEHYAV